MTGYRIPWRKIESEADLPEKGRRVLVLMDGVDVWTDAINEHGVFEGEYIGAGCVIAWAPLPAPYDPDEAEPVDPRDAEIAALKARCERLVKAVRAHREVSYAKADAHLLAHEEARFVESHWKVDDARYQLRDAMDAVDEHGDLEVSE